MQAPGLRRRCGGAAAALAQAAMRLRRQRWDGAGGAARPEVERARTRFHVTNGFRPSLPMVMSGSAAMPLSAISTTAQKRIMCGADTCAAAGPRAGRG